MNFGAKEMPMSDRKGWADSARMGFDRLLDGGRSRQRSLVRRGSGTCGAAHFSITNLGVYPPGAPHSTPLSTSTVSYKDYDSSGIPFTPNNSTDFTHPKETQRSLQLIRNGIQSPFYLLHRWCEARVSVSAPSVFSAIEAIDRKLG